MPESTEDHIKTSEELAAEINESLKKHGQSEAAFKTEKDAREKAQREVEESTKKAEEAGLLKEEKETIEEFMSPGVKLQKFFEEQKQKWVTSFSMESAKSEVACLARDIEEAMATFVSLERKEIEAASKAAVDKNLSIVGKKNALLPMQYAREETFKNLKNTQARLEAFENGLELEAVRQETISEDEFTMIRGDTGAKAEFCIYSELKFSRLEKEFEFVALSRKDGKSHIDYDWLLQLYEGGRVRKDKAKMHFVEKIMEATERNPLNFVALNEKAGISKGALQRAIEKERAARIDSELNNMIERVEFLRRKSNKMNELARKDAKEERFKFMKRFWT